MEEFHASITVDQRLARQDIRGSIAHVDALKAARLLTAKEAQKIKDGLEAIRDRIQQGRFKFLKTDEDIHMAIESALTKLIGKHGGKMHTGRSRNDQVSLDMRLYAREQTRLVLNKIRALQRVLVDRAAQNLNTILPGYTHLQRAQPVLLAHHLLAYFEMLQRDHARFTANLDRLKECPLGAGALAGTTVPVNRHRVAKQLKFGDVTHNSLDTVSDRDFVIDFLSAASVLMMHLSRMAEDLILWNTREFGFVILPQEFCTGSSMMPQKVNPDALELIRGKTGRVYGNLMSLLTTMKALPLSYNKDMQEDKEPFFDSLDTVTQCLSVMTALFKDIRFDVARMLQATQEGFLLATDLADYLAKKGLPFREAHGVVGRLVRQAIKNGCGLEDLDLPTLKKASKFFENDVKDVLSIKAGVEARKSVGGTASDCVKKEIARARKIVMGNG